MLIHQDASRHAWVPGQLWDLVVTMDDATNEHYSMFFVPEEGTASSFRGMREAIGKKGLPSALYTDRGSHYWITPEAGGKVDKKNLTQFGRAMKHLGIEMIPAYSPETRGQSEGASGPIRNVFPKSWPWLGSRPWRMPTGIWTRSIVRPSMPSLAVLPPRKGQPLFRGRETLWTRSSASTTNGSLAMTTASILKAGPCRSHPTGTASIMSGQQSAFIGIRMDL